MTALRDHPCDPRVTIKKKFISNFNTKEEFFKYLEDFNFLDPNLVRPTFDKYFIRLAWLAASRSNCMKRGNGAIIT